MRRTLIALLVTLLAGCASSPSEEDRQRAARDLYESASQALDNGRYRDAVEEYEQLQSEYPFGDYADQAQLDMIFAYYQLGEAESALAAADRFIRRNPRSDKAPYAWYMRGVVEQERSDSSLVGTAIDSNRARRDPAPLERAFDHFRQLIERYPDSQYVSNAQERMKEIRRKLAWHDLYVAEFYRDREAWVAVANRAERIIQRYPSTPAVAEALKLLEQAYGAMELSPLRRDVERILRENGIDPASAAG